MSHYGDSSRPAFSTAAARDIDDTLSRMRSLLQQTSKAADLVTQTANEDLIGRATRGDLEEEFAEFASYLRSSRYRLALAACSAEERYSLEREFDSLTVQLRDTLSSVREGKAKVEDKHRRRAERRRTQEEMQRRIDEEEERY